MYDLAASAAATASTTTAVHRLLHPLLLECLEFGYLFFGQD